MRHPGRALSGLLLAWLGTACGGQPGSPVFDLADLPLRPVKLDRETRQAFADSPSRVKLRMELPASGSLVGAVGAACDGTVDLHVRFSTEAGETWEIVDLRFDVAREEAGWREWRAEIPPQLGGFPGTLELDVGTPAGCDVELTPPATVGAAGDEARPNIILISLDTLRADRLGCYGNPHATSPSLDRLAAEGILFTDAVAPSSWTLPSHFSMFTSLYPSAHGLNPPQELWAGYRRPSRAVGLRSSGVELTLAERLRPLGYMTAGITEDGWVDADFGFDQGFVSFVSDTAGTLPSTERRLVDWLERNGDLPFFLFLHTYQPHQPYEQPEPYRTMFLEPGHLGFARADDVVSMETIALLRDPTFPVLGSDQRAFAALYDGDVRYTDTLIERLLEVLERLGLSDDTLIVVTSDHGEELFEHGGFNHGGTVYEEVMRVPMIFRWPGRWPTPRRIEAPVSVLDLLPTLVELAGAAVESPVQGRSLVPLLRGDAGAGQQTVDRFGEVFTRDEGHLRCLWSGHYKYILADRGEAAERLFDLSRDPGETVNLAAQLPDVTQRLRARVEEWQSTNAELQEQLGRSGEAIDPEVLERLRSLGYVD